MSSAKAITLICLVSVYRFSASRCLSWINSSLVSLDQVTSFQSILFRSCKRVMQKKMQLCLMNASDGRTEMDTREEKNSPASHMDSVLPALSEVTGRMWLTLLRINGQCKIYMISQFLSATVSLMFARASIYKIYAYGRDCM